MQDDPRVPPEIADKIGYQLRRAQLSVFAKFNEQFAALDLRPAQFTLLAVLDAAPGIVQSRAGELLGIQKANFTPFVASLERRSLVARVRLDGRTNGLRLTPQGRALLRRARRLADQHERAVTAALSARERQTLADLLERVTASARAGAATASRSA
jgi:DNA-binding MarR family transcriptional regulator